MSENDISKTAEPDTLEPRNTLLGRFSYKQLVSYIWIAFAGGSVFLALNAGAAELLRQSVQLGVPLLLLATAISAVGMFLSVLIWRGLLNYYGIHQSLRSDLQIYCYAALGVAIPGGIWSIVGRSVFYGRLGVSKIHVVAASIVEAFIVGVAGLGIYFFSMTLEANVTPWQRNGQILGIIVLVLCLMHPRIFNPLNRWMLRRSQQNESTTLSNYRFSDLAGWLALETGVLILGGLALFVLLNSLAPASIEVLPRIVTAWAASTAISSLLFWLPGTPVLRDGAMVIVLSPSLPLPLIVLYVVLVRFWSIAALLVMSGVVWLLWGRGNKAREGISD